MVGELKYTDEYQEQEQVLLSLNGRGIPVFSLTNVYEDVTETIYMDRIHHPKGSPAYSVMGDRLVEVLAREWQFERTN